MTPEWSLPKRRSQIRTLKNVHFGLFHRAFSMEKISKRLATSQRRSICPRSCRTAMQALRRRIRATRIIATLTSRLGRFRPDRGAALLSVTSGVLHSGRSAALAEHFGSRPGADSYLSDIGASAFSPVSIPIYTKPLALQHRIYTRAVAWYFHIYRINMRT